MMAPLRPVILIVDDEETALNIRKLVVEQAGYAVATASGAREAMELLRGQPVDLVLSDQIMPGMDGAELAREIKGIWPRLPVLLLSGVSELPEGVEFVDGFLSKTDGPVRMLETIAATLAGSTGSQAQSA